MSYRITLIPGDGIGPEISVAACRVVEATGVKVVWEECLAGAAGVKAENNPLPDETLRSIEKNRIALKGQLETPIGTGYASINVLLRKELNLYANLRPVKSLEGVKTHYPDTDLVVLD